MSSSLALSFLPARVLMATLAVFGGAILFCFDPGGYSFFPVCLFHQTTGLLCPGCGSLRALHQLLHGHLLIAFHFNPLLLLALPVAGWYATAYAARKLTNLTTVREDFLPVPSGRDGAIARRVGEHRDRFSVRPLWFWLFLAASLAFAVWRNLPSFPIPMPSS